MCRVRLPGLLCLVLLTVLQAGCSRSYWRRNADSEAYGLIVEKTKLDARWTPPRSDIVPSPLSRLYDPTDPDYGALPPDDPAAHRYMRQMSDCDRIGGSHYWDEIGTGHSIENPAWVASLPVGDRPGPLVADADPSATAGESGRQGEVVSETDDQRQPFLERFAITHSLRSIFRKDPAPVGRATIATAEVPPDRPRANANTANRSTEPLDRPGSLAGATLPETPTPAERETVSKPATGIMLASHQATPGPDEAPAPLRLPDSADDRGSSDAAPLSAVPLPPENGDADELDEVLESAVPEPPSTDSVVDLTAGNPALPRVEEVKLRDAISLAYLHSREYQFALEEVFLAALDLAFDRFQFDVRFLGITGGRPSGGLDYAATPHGPKSLTGTARVGMSRLLPAGGQWFVELANETLWLFSNGPNESGTASTLTFSFIQPLLFAAGRKVVLEDLTQSERNLLYAVRDLARFRQEFFVSTVTGGQSGGFLGLMQQIQTIANQEDNIRRLEEQLTIAEENTLTGDALSRTQLQSQLLQQQNQLRSSRAQLQNQLDRFKIQLGLPPDLEMALDTTFLIPFQLISPELMVLEGRVDDDYFAVAEAIDPDHPDPETLRRALETLVPILDEIATVAIPQVEEDFRRVQRSMPKRMAALTQRAREQLRRDLARDARLFEAAKEQLIIQAATVEQLLAQVEVEINRPDEVREERKAARAAFEQARQDARSAQTPEDREQTQEVLGEARRRNDEVFADLQALYVSAGETEERVERIVRGLQGIQVGLRTELIELNPFEMPLTEAVGYALTNRVDLMNQRALVTDARRKVEVAANAMRGILDVRVEQEVSTRPIFNNDNPLDFRRTEGTFRAGVQFVAPLNQIAQRNAYRVSQITYQRVRRSYMAAEDGVKFDVRQAWRNIQVLKQNFEVARNAIRINAQQYDLAVERTTGPSRRGSGSGGGGGGGGGGGSSGADQQGLNMINALQRLLNSQNQLIGIWVDYESARLNIYRDMGIMEIDEQGLWVEPFYQNDLLLPDDVDAVGLPGWVAPAANSGESAEGNDDPAMIPPVPSPPAGVEQPGADLTDRAPVRSPALIRPASDQRADASDSNPPSSPPSEAGHDRSRQPPLSDTKSPRKPADGSRTDSPARESDDPGWRPASVPASS